MGAWHKARRRLPLPGHPRAVRARRVARRAAVAARPDAAPRRDALHPPRYRRRRRRGDHDDARARRAGHRRDRRIRAFACGRCSCVNRRGRGRRGGRAGQFWARRGRLPSTCAGRWTASRRAWRRRRATRGRARPPSTRRAPSTRRSATPTRAWRSSAQTLLPAETRYVLTLCNTVDAARRRRAVAPPSASSSRGGAAVASPSRARVRDAPAPAGRAADGVGAQQHDVPFRLVVEGAAASLMAAGRVSAVVTGADRVGANGDTANKIGTYMLAVLARHARASRSTSSRPSPPSTPTRPTARRSRSRSAPRTRCCARAARLAAPGARALNPAFDVTPAGAHRRDRDRAGRAASLPTVPRSPRPVAAASPASVEVPS